MYDCFRIRCFRFAYSLNRADAALTFFMDCILVTGAFKGTSSARLHARELLSIRRELHKLSQFYKIVKNLAPRYLNELLSELFSERTHFRLKSRENVTQLCCRTSIFQNSFFPSAITGWNSLDLDVRNSVSPPTLKAKTWSIIFPHTYNRLSDYSFTRRASVDHTHLRPGFSCIREYLFKVNSCVSPICKCSFDSESVKHFPCIAQGMPLNVMSSLPLMLIF